jgi:hypothetical protein
MSGRCSPARALYRAEVVLAISAIRPLPVSR